MKQILLIILFLTTMLLGCEGQKDPISSSGVSRMTTKVRTDSNGYTTEQKNVSARLKMDNQAGAIKHLYIVSATTGDVLLYSTVKGKVTSSGKRLTPVTVDTDGIVGFPIYIGGRKVYTGEVIQDDGTYGNSIAYLYWWDARGAYHQHYVTGGQFPHISDQPMAWPKIILNLEAPNTTPVEADLEKKTEAK